MISASGTPGYETYYGSSRNKEDAKLRDLLCRSAVLRPKDREKGESEWNSTNRINFKKHEMSAVPKTTQWNANLQNASDITFGNTDSILESTVKSDFVEKQSKRRQSLPPPVLCSLPDMSSKYVGDFQMGDTMYQNHFDGTMTYQEWLSEEKALAVPTARKRSKSTDYQRCTHFILGNDPTPTSTETKVSFTLPTLSNPITAMGLTRFPHSSPQRQKSTRPRTGTARLPPNPDAGFNPAALYPPRDGGGPAGVSTVTPKGYSHVLPKLMQIKSSEGTTGAIGSLRSHLLSENYQQFQNPRDPTSVNVLSAFTKYDTDRSGYIEAESLRQICEDIGTPITDMEIGMLLEECDPLGDGKIDYVEFAKYLLAEHVPLDIEGTYESTTQNSFHPLPSEMKGMSTSRPRSGKPTLANQTAVKFADFSICEDSDKDWSEKFGTNFQTGTHFEFGNFKERPQSVYQQDINYEHGSSRPSYVLAGVLPDSQIFPVNKNLRPQTTNRGEFRAPERADTQLKGQESTEYRDRDRMDSVVLSDGLKQIKLTETQLNFKTPPNAEHCSSLAPPPTSLLLLSQQPAMERPLEYAVKETEAQRTFRSPQSIDGDIVRRQRAETSRTSSRLKDNRQTHFEFGSSKEHHSSEMNTQFKERGPDTSTVAAGSLNLPTSHFSHVFPREKKKTNEKKDDSLILENKIKRAATAKHVNPRDPVNLNLRKAFLEFDKDLCGRIAPHDIVNICIQQGINITDQDLQELMERCDHDRDGLIDYHDFSRYLTRQHSTFTRQEVPESTTMRDFKPIEQRFISDEKERLDGTVKKRYTPSAASHYFHLDHENKPFASATKQHFQHPLALLRTSTYPKC